MGPNDEHEIGETFFKVVYGREPLAIAWLGDGRLGVGQGIILDLFDEIVPAMQKAIGKELRKPGRSFASTRENLHRRLSKRMSPEFARDLDEAIMEWHRRPCQCPTCLRKPVEIFEGRDFLPGDFRSPPSPAGCLQSYQAQAQALDSVQDPNAWTLILEDEDE